jgi:molybdopterin/thiamine biosynthesis adenylyltransferase
MSIPEEMTDQSENPLFYSSFLLFSEEDRERLVKATVGVVGIGGVGSIAAEMLARAGIGAFKLADPDVYQDVNLNRQLHATMDTIGCNKAKSASERIIGINPGCKTRVFEKGIIRSNVEEFCTGVDVLISQGDAPSSIILIHRMASLLGIPVVTGARSSLEKRWRVKATVWNYKENSDIVRDDEVHYDEFVKIPFEKLTQESLSVYDREHSARRNEVFKKLALSRPEAFESISSEELRKKIDTGSNFYNRHVCSVVANTAGCLAATAALKLLLGGPETELEIDLWNGSYSRAL